MRGSQLEETPSHRGARTGPGWVGTQVSSARPVLAGVAREECWSRFGLWGARRGAGNSVLAVAFIIIINNSSNR